MLGDRLAVIGGLFSEWVGVRLRGSFFWCCAGGLTGWGWVVDPGFYPRLLYVALLGLGGAGVVLLVHVGFDGGLELGDFIGVFGVGG